MTETIKERDMVRSLARGLAVIRAFENGPPRLTPSDVARRAGLTRAAARRSLLTLVAEGYARTDGKRFSLAPAALDLGRAYLTGMGMRQRALSVMERLSAATGFACAVGVMERDAVRLIARVPSGSSAETPVGLATRRPAYATALGRILLAGMPDQAYEHYLDSTRPRSLTALTVTDTGALRHAIDRVRETRWALVDQEFRIGVRCIAVPLIERRGVCDAAIAVTCDARAMSIETMRRDTLPRLRAVSAQIAETDPLALPTRGFGEGWPASVGD